MRQPINDSLLDHYNRWRNNKYLPTEIQQINLILDFYRKFIGQDIPELFKIDPLNINDHKKVSIESCYLYYWEKKVGGTLHHEIKDLINEICVYQTQRVDKNQGYLNDPRHLFLHEVKIALIDISNKQDLSQAKELAFKWLNFINELWYADVFNPANNEKTMKSTLRGIILNLNEKIIPTLKFKIANSSALENVNVLGKNLKILFEHAIRFLLMVYRDAPKVPLNITVAQINNPTYQEMKDVMATGSALILCDIAKLNKNLLEFDVDENNKQICINGQSDHTALQLARSSFNFDDAKDILLNPELKNSGIDEYFRRQDCIGQYLNGCLLIQELCKYYHLFLLIEKCAKEGGDLLVHGICGQKLYEDIIGCAELLDQLERSLEAIHEEGSKRWTNVGKPSDSEANWKLNFDQARLYYSGFIQSIQHCTTSLNSISTANTIRKQKKCIEDAEKAKKQYIKFHDEFNEYRKNNIARYPQAQISLSSQSQEDQTTVHDCQTPVTTFGAAEPYVGEINSRGGPAADFLLQHSSSNRLSAGDIRDLVNPEEDLTLFIKLLDSNRHEEAYEKAKSICLSNSTNIDIKLRCILEFYKKKQFKLALLLLDESLLKEKNKLHPYYYGQILFHGAMICYSISNEIKENKTVYKINKMRHLERAKRLVELAADTELSDNELKQLATLKTEINLTISRNPELVSQYESRSNSESVQRIPGLIYQPVPGDGHCLFHAVGLYANQGQADLRRIIAAHLEHNINNFRAFIQLPERQTIEDYIRAIREGKEWGDHIEIEVLMRVLDRPIIVIGPDSIIRNREVLERGLRGEPIFVLYNGHNHYDSFIRREGTSSQDILSCLTQSNALQQAPSNIAPKAAFLSSPASSPNKKIVSSQILPIREINLLETLLTKAKVLLYPENNKELVQIVFVDHKLVQQFSDELHKIGISNLGMKSQPRKPNFIAGKEGKEDHYIIILTSDEYNAVMNNEDAYAKLLCCSLPQNNFRV